MKVIWLIIQFFDSTQCMLFVWTTSCSLQFFQEYFMWRISFCWRDSFVVSLYGVQFIFLFSLFYAKCGHWPMPLEHSGQIHSQYSNTWMLLIQLSLTAFNYPLFSPRSLTGLRPGHRGYDSWDGLTIKRMPKKC